MRLKKNPCQNWKLYVITDFDAIGGRSIESVVWQAILGGADVIQLRHKKAADEELVMIARKLLPLTRSKNIPLILNDRVEAARLIGADGLHLGQDDGSLSEARQALGDGVIVGRSTHSPAQAMAAEKEGFDYIGVGPIFKTPTKPTTTPVGLDLLRFAAENVSIPFVAIGGIDEKNVKEVRAAGARTIAVVRAVMGASDPMAAAKKLKGKMANEN